MRRTSKRALVVIDHANVGVGCDVKSLNMLVMQAFAVKVADFGTARRMDDKTTGAVDPANLLSGAGKNFSMTTSVGSPPWMAPLVFLLAPALAC